MIYRYEEEFIAKVKDFAVIGLYPPQIAERLELIGDERVRFLEDITNPDHSLCRIFYSARKSYEDDLDAALQTASVSGDAKALKLSYELRHRDYVEDIRRKLFDI